MFLLQKKTFSAVINFAGSIKVEESVKFPEKYFTNNTNNSEKLFATCLKNDLTNIIFSSTAAVYGNPTSSGLVNENAKLNFGPQYHEFALKPRFCTFGVPRGQGQRRVLCTTLSKEHIELIEMICYRSSAPILPETLCS